MSKLITGNTYPVKDAIRALGGRWDKQNKGWQVPDDRAGAARALVAAAPPVKSRSKYGSGWARFSSGAETFTNRNGRCIDAPCCGCCS